MERAVDDEVVSRRKYESLRGKADKWRELAEENTRVLVEKTDALVAERNESEQAQARLATENQKLRGALDEQTYEISSLTRKNVRLEEELECMQAALRHQKAKAKERLLETKEDYKEEIRTLREEKKDLIMAFKESHA